MKKFALRRLSFYLGLLTLILWVSLSVLLPFLSLEDPNHQVLSLQYQRPSWQNWFGRGVNGVDLFSQVLWGARLSLGVGFGSVFLAAFIGLILGSWAGYVRGWVDIVLMRIVDVLYAFPGILLVVALAAVLGPSLKNLIFVLVITSWAGYARLIRGLCLSLREREFVKAAEANGSSLFRILVFHLWPNTAGPLLVQMTFGLGGVIMVESSLSFLGLGAPPSVPSWGMLLNQGRDVFLYAPHMILFPGLALVLCVLGMNLLGDGLRDLLDPKTKSLIR